MAASIVSGAKVVATSAALTHYNFMGQNAAMPIEDRRRVMFMVPINAPGLKLFCRTSYEKAASVMGTPFDYPLSSRFDENDAIFVFDKVLHPLGGRVHLPRHREDPESSIRAPASPTASSSRAAPGSRSSSISSSACWPRRCAAPAATSSAATR